MKRTYWYTLNHIIDTLKEFNKKDKWSVIEDCIGDLIAFRTDLADEVLYNEFKKEFPERFVDDYDENIS